MGLSRRGCVQDLAKEDCAPLIRHVYRNSFNLDGRLGLKVLLLGNNVSGRRFTCLSSSSPRFFRQDGYGDAKIFWCKRRSRSTAYSTLGPLCNLYRG